MVDFNKTLNKIKAVAFDLDGTLYLGNRLIDGVIDTLAAIRASGKRVCFLTNNSSSSRTQYTERLSEMGLYEEDDIFLSSTMAAVDFLKTERKDKSVFALATDSVKEEIKGSGVELTDKNADIALLCFDKTLNYEKILAFDNLLRGGAEYIATHLDLVCPSENGFIPDAGSFERMFFSSSGRSPDIVIGKPEIYMGKYLLKILGARKEEVLFVGDRLYTDIRFANNCGFYSLLVFSGETKESDYESSKDEATFTAADVNVLRKYL